MKKDGMLTTNKQCWTDGKCFAASRTLDGEECNCQSKTASESCQQKCFDECTLCNCADAKARDDGSVHACVQDMVLHQQFEWAATVCKAACVDETNTQCLRCRQKHYTFIDKCSMASPYVGGNQAMCQGDVAFDFPNFVQHQHILNCTNPEGCQVYNLDDYSQVSSDTNDWIENDHMPLEAWYDAATRWWTEMDGRASYPNVFAQDTGNTYNHLHPIGSDEMPWELHHYPGSRRLSNRGQSGGAYMMSGCKWNYGDWEPLTPQSWSAGSREFQEDLVHRVEVVQSSLGSNPSLDQCQTAGMRVSEDEDELDQMSLANWDFAEGVLVAMSLTYILIFAMKTFILRKTWISLTNDLKELDNSQKESLSEPVRRMEKPGCCSKMMRCFLKLEMICEKIQSPFFSAFTILMPSYTLSPLLQATCHSGFIIAPAGDVWTIRKLNLPLLGIIVWWFACQIVAQWSQRCTLIKQFLNVVSLCPFTVVGALIMWYEMIKLSKTGIGFEFALFFKHLFSFSFSVGIELSVDLLQVLFSVTVLMDILAGLAGSFTKRDWKEKCIFSCLIQHVKNAEPAQKKTEVSCGASV